MRMNEVEGNGVISIGRFLNEYVLPIYGGKMTATEIDSLAKMSHLDLDELNIPLIKRCSDEYAVKDPNIILVEGYGRNHRGYEVHGYYRPFNLKKDELLSNGYSEEEANMMLLNSIPDYSFNDFDYEENTRIVEINKKRNKKRNRKRK